MSAMSEGISQPDAPVQPDAPAPGERGDLFSKFDPLIRQREALLEQEGVLFRAPFIESTTLSPKVRVTPAEIRPIPASAAPPTRPNALRANR